MNVTYNVRAAFGASTLPESFQNVQFFDKRVLDVKAEAKELTASDEKRVIVDAFAKFRIVNTVQFIKTVHNYQGAQLRLNRILESAMRTVIGKFPLNTLLTDKRANLMLQIRDLTYSEAKNFGVEVIDVRTTVVGKFYKGLFRAAVFFGLVLAVPVPYSPGDIKSVVL